MFGSLRWHYPDQVHWVYSQLFHLVSEQHPYVSQYYIFFCFKKNKNNQTNFDKSIYLFQ